MGLSWIAEPGAGQPDLHLTALGLTVASLADFYSSSPGPGPALGAWEGSPEQWGSLALVFHLSAHPSGIWGVIATVNIS